MFERNVPRSRTERLASEFPERADIYLCDTCKRDITKHLSPGQSHSRRPMGPQRYTCACGATYLTGAAEWDDLSERERKRRISETVFVGILISVMLAVPAALFWFLFAWLFHSRSPLLRFALVMAIPFLIYQAIFWLQVAASKWRTR